MLQSPQSHSAEQLKQDISYLLMFGALSYGGTLLGLPGMGTSMLTMLGGLSFVDRMKVHAKRYFGAQDFNEQAQELLDKIKCISGFKEEKLYDDEYDPQEELRDLIQLIHNNVYNPYTTVKHIQAAHHILDLMDDYLNATTGVVVVESQRPERQKAFCEVFKGAHFVMDAKKRDALKLEAVAQPKITAHYKQQKVAALKQDLEDLRLVLRGPGHYETISEKRRVFLIETYLKEDEQESLKEFYWNTREIEDGALGMITPLIEKVERRILLHINQLSKDDVSGLNHIDTDVSLCAGPIFHECLVGRVNLGEQKIIWAQLEAQKQERDVETEGPFTKIVNGLLNIVSLNGMLFSYNTNQLGHDVNQVLEQRYYHDTKHVSQYGVSDITERFLLEQRESLLREKMNKLREVRQSPSIGELLRRKPSIVTSQIHRAHSDSTVNTSSRTQRVYQQKFK